jgi:prevent-host-death family protein
MARKAAAPKRKASSPPTQRPEQRLAAAHFKARCLELMDRVRETGAEYVVTKHGTPVAKLVPYRDQVRHSFLGCLKGTVLGYERPFDPIPGPWNIDRGLLVDDDT